MDSIFIAVYVGKILENKTTVTPQEVQTDIYDDPNVEKIVALEDIVFTLDRLTDAAFLEKLNDHECGKWRRYVPPALIRSIEQNGKRMSVKKWTPPSSGVSASFNP
jgi:hypothetical protein